MPGQRPPLSRNSPRRRGRRSGSDVRETLASAAAHAAAPPCPCGARRTGRGTAPTCPAADTLHRRRRRERRDVDPVGDLDGVAAEGSICQRRARSDTAMRPTIFSCIGRRNPSNTLSARDRRRGVERRHDRPLGDVQRQHRQARRVGLVQVQHVELALARATASPAVRRRPEPQPRHRPVVRDRHRLAARHDVVGHRSVRRGRAPAR